MKTVLLSNVAAAFAIFIIPNSLQGKKILIQGHYENLKKKKKKLFGKELDLNPLNVTAKGRGKKAVDAFGERKKKLFSHV